MRTQELAESQIQEFQERLRNMAEQMVQNVTKRPSTHKGDKSNIV